MKKELTLGTPAVPAPRRSAAERTRELLNKWLPSDCQVRTSQDAWYVSTVACAALTLIFPPAVLVTGYCLMKAKKGGER